MGKESWLIIFVWKGRLLKGLRIAYYYRETIKRYYMVPCNFDVNIYGFPSIYELIRFKSLWRSADYTVFLSIWYCVNDWLLNSFVKNGSDLIKATGGP